MYLEMNTHKRISEFRDLDWISMRLTPRMNPLRLHRFFRHINDRPQLNINVYRHNHVPDIVTYTVSNSFPR